MLKRLKKIMSEIHCSFESIKRKISPEKEFVDNLNENNLDSKEIYKGEYYFDFKNGLRCVYPYYFQYYSFAKKRWIGKSISEMYNNEFYFKKEDSIKNLFKNKKIFVNDKPAEENYLIKEGDIISTKVHRHENNVLATKIDIISETDEILVINKPSSIPVHSTGKYRLNSILSILYKEYSYKKLFTVHRLDRLTSGVLIFAKTRDVAIKIQNSILSKDFKKEYICKVSGVFPDGEIVCDQPISRLEFRMGLHIVKPDGKPSLTTFKKLYSDGKISILLCKPKTGRTHQIRVHLQYLGYPILNDPLYNSFSFGPNKGKDAEYLKMDLNDLRTTIYKEHPISIWSESSISLDSFELNKDLDEETINKIRKKLFDTHVQNLEVNDDHVDEYISNLKKQQFFNSSEQIEFLNNNKNRKFDQSKFYVDEICENCRIIFKKQTYEDFILYLHALRYYNDNMKDFSFYAEPPNWAKFSSDFDFKNITL